MNKVGVHLVRAGLIASLILGMTTIESSPTRGIGWQEEAMGSLAEVVGVTVRVSVASDGTAGIYGSGDASISGDGCYVAFASYAHNLVDGDTNNNIDVFVHGRRTGSTERVSVSINGIQGNDYTCRPSISGDGHYVAFMSNAIQSGGWRNQP